MEKVNELIGLNNLYNAYMDFDEVRIPVENRLGREGEGWRVMMSGLNLERTMTAAVMVGMMREALRYAIFHMERRLQFGDTIINLRLPTNQFKVANMISTYNTARLLTYYNAYLVDMGKESSVDTAIAKLFSTEAGMNLFIEAVQCMGGDGVTKFYPVERFIRDTKIIQIATGTNEIMKVIMHGMGLRQMREDLKPPRRRIHEELKVPFTVGFGFTPGKKEGAEEREVKEENILAVLAENYRVNPGLQ